MLNNIEKAKERLTKRCEKLKLDYAITYEDLEAIKTVLQELENSISKDTIREEIEKLKELIEECCRDERYCGEKPIYSHDIQMLKKLLRED